MAASLSSPFQPGASSPAAFPFPPPPSSASAFPSALSSSSSDPQKQSHEKLLKYLETMAYPHAGLRTQYPLSFMDTCTGRVLVGGVMGAGMGVAIGLLFGNGGLFGPMGGMANPMGPLAMPGAMGRSPLDPQALPGYYDPTSSATQWAQTKQMFKDMGRTAKSNAKTWGTLSAVYSGSECTIEKWRGHSDEWSPVLAGCVTGGALSFRAGPSAAAMGCGGFAAFSYVIDKVMHSMGH